MGIRSSSIHSLDDRLSTEKESMIFHKRVYSQHKGKERIRGSLECIYDDDLFIPHDPFAENYDDIRKKGNNGMEARDMILDVIMEAELRHLTFIVQEFNIKSSEKNIRSGKCKKHSKKKYENIIIARQEISESLLQLGPGINTRTVAYNIYNSGVFKKYGTIVKKWTLFVKEVLVDKYKPDDYWCMLLFFTTKYKRCKESSDLLNTWNPFNDRRKWESKVIRLDGRDDIVELYGIVGVVIRTIMVKRPDIYLEPVPSLY